MCYYTQQSATIEKVGKRFRAAVDFDENFLVSDYIVGFEYLNVPIILNSTPEVISTNFSWGLLPAGAEPTFRKNTLNARIETLDQKRTFQNITHNRCLVIATAYFDWHWNDEKGKSKTKYIVQSADDEVFAFGGLFSSYIENGSQINTFTIVTTQANEQMRYVHNRKAGENDQRMPLMLRKDDENSWLNPSNHYRDFAFPNYKQNLVMFPI